MATNCKKCAYDFETLRWDVDMKTILRQQGGIEGDRIRIHCPACHEDNRIDLHPYGIFSLNEQLYRWTESVTGGMNIDIGRMRLKLPPGDQIKVIKDQDVRYETVPVFRLANGQLSFPRWPVRKEFLQVIDLDVETVPKPELVNDRYSIDIYFKGRSKPVPLNLECVPVSPERQPMGDNAAFEGVNLTLWPNVPYKDWKRYFLRFDCADEHARKLFTSSREVNVFALAAGELTADKEKPPVPNWVPVNAIASNGYTRYGCLESRPSYVAVEFGNKSGGIWEIPPATDGRYPPGMGTKLAVDFGTSNTCVAVVGERGEPEFIAIESCDLPIIQGAPLSTRLNFADTWPPRQGFGKKRALLPTELLTREKLDEVRINVERIAQWRPVVDYGVPSSGNQVEFPEDNHLIAEFKWDERIQDNVLRPYAPEMQRCYIEFTVLFALAQLARVRKVNSQVDVSFSFPLAFEQSQQESFVELLEGIVKAVSMMTGLSLMLNTPLLDEARAAASSLVTHGPACLYVDIGGGSSDIALDIIRTDDKGESSVYKYIASFQYAGGALVDAYDGGKCLSVNLNTFRRMIRESGVTEMLKKGRGFQPRPERVRAKTFYFYGYLMEFLARMLAAHIISGEWLERVSKEQKKQISLDGYQVELYPLGNGWGFGQILDPHYAISSFARDLSKRTNEILEDAKQKLKRPDLPQVRVKVPEGFGKDDPKEAVVFGLLKSKSSEFRQRLPVDWQYRTIVGQTTKVGPTRVVPWYRPVDDRATLLDGGKVSDGEGELPNASLTCPPNEWPDFITKLVPPHELDPGLNKTSNALQTCLFMASKWFHQSPFHVILEKLIKPKLKELG
jgi:hypothetical protein